MKHAAALFSLLLVFSPLSVQRSLAISEKNYERDYESLVLPFLKSGDRFTFLSADGKYSLSGIKFIHSNAKGLVLVVNGRAESWLKYGELFYDLHHAGYSIISYDHRGQGLSPRLIDGNPEIGYVDQFENYVKDMDSLMKTLTPINHGASDPSGPYLIADSLGGAIAVRYLELHPAFFQAVVLTSPMLAINTTPYPSGVAHAMVSFFEAIGLGSFYAPGEHDYDPAATFDSNRVTSSIARWRATQATWREYPRAILGGASNRWVKQSMEATGKIRRQLSAIKTRILLLQAGRDQLVLNKPLQVASKRMQDCRLVNFPDSKHEILFERDTIRSHALQEIVRFFNEK